jgi:hypothetical protein
MNVTKPTGCEKQDQYFHLQTRLEGDNNFKNFKLKNPSM